MEPPVGREHGTVVDRGPAGEVGEAPARLLDEDLHRRHIPGLEVHLDVDLGLARGHEPVAVVVTEPARPVAGIEEPDEPVPVTGLAQQAQPRVEHRGAYHGVAIGDAEPLAVQEGPLASSRREQLAGHRIQHDPGRDLPALLERDEHRPDGNAPHEILGAIDGVDDPARFPRAGLAELLAQEAPLRKGPPEKARDGVLGLAVGLRDGSLVGLDRDVESATIVLHRDLPRGAGRLDGGRQGRMRRSAHASHSPRSSRTCLSTSTASSQHQAPWAAPWTSRYSRVTLATGPSLWG